MIPPDALAAIRKRMDSVDYRCADAGRRFMFRLQAELAELERTDPEVAAAADALDAVPDYFARTERWQAARRQVRGES